MDYQQRSIQPPVLLSRDHHDRFWVVTDGEKAAGGMVEWVRPFKRPLRAGPFSLTLLANV